MKKRLLSALLALALVFVLLPTTALAEVTTENDYDISINGIGWKFERDNTSGAYIPAYYYHTNEFSADENYRKLYTNDNLMLTKEGNTVTITIRRGTSHDHRVYPIEFTLKKESTSTEKNDVPCIEMGNDNNLVITGKGTLNITRNESKSYGAALYSNVGDITINGGITVNVSFLNGNDYLNKNTTSNAIHVGNNHNLTVSGSGTNVTATNQGFDSSPATVCVEGGTITVSGGASLSATNTYADNFSGSSVTQHFISYAISGTESKPCTLIVADEKSSVTAWAYDEKYGKPFGFVTYNITGATVKAGSNNYNSTETTIDKIDGKEYVKISIPALEKDSYVSIAGESAVVGVETKIPTANGSGTYFYDQASKTLTLNNVTINKTSNNAAKAIQFDKNNGTYTVNLVGTNTISNVSYGISTNSAYSEATSMSVTITGSGSLDISAKAYAIEVPKGDLTFNGTGEIKLTTGHNYVTPRNALYVAGNVTIDTTKYAIEGEKQVVNPTTEDIGNSPVFETILKGTDSTLYFKTITIAPKPSKTYYNNTAMKYGETRTVGNGTISCDENGVITLNGVTEGTLEFRSSSDSTLVLEGTSTLSSIVTTQKGLTISGSGSLTVGSIRVTNNYNIHADLTITDSATVIAGTTTSDAKAIDITGNLTVNSGATLTATNTSETKPTIDVTGNVTISGDPGTNAYTVSAHNSCDVQKDRVGNLSPSGVPSAIKIGGTLNISAGARVMAQTDSYGAGVMLGQNSTITVEDAFLSAKNSSCDFAAISFSGYMGDINVSGENGKVVAENTHTNIGQSLALKAINAFVYNRNTDFYLKMQSEGVIAEAVNKIIAPGEYDASGGKKVTITRGDEVTPVVIAGTPLLNDTYYTITNGSTVVANGSKDNYNAFYESATKTLKLNNAQISHSFAHENGGGRDGAIIFTKFENYFIELSGENTISSTNTYAINCHRPDRTLTIKNAAGAENAKLTLTSNWMVVCSIGGLNIQSDVTMINTKKADYLMYVNGTFSYTGYNAYASTEASGSPLEVYNPENYSTYKYLRITKETLETGGGSTHEHVFSTSWESNADYHWHKCTVQGCTEVSDKEAHVYTNTWWKNSNGNHGRTCDKCRHEGEIHEFRKYYDFVDATYHVERCSYPNCTYVGSNETHSYDSFGVCKCGYSPNGLPAPPSLQGVAPTSENGTDGKILNSNIGMEYAQNLNGPWTKWNEHSNITGLSAGTYYVRYTKTDERFPDNQVATVEVPAYTPGGDPTPDVPAAPTGLVGVAPTSENGNGKITGTTAQMEYASSLEGDWTTCANDSTDVPAGKYYVRMKKTDNTPAGEAVEVTVPAYSGTGEIVPPTPDNPGTIVIIRPAEEEKPAQQPNPSTGANDLVGLAVAAAVAAALGSAALLRKHD